MAIRFGTDGWRAVIADEFTFHNVRACARGVAGYLEDHGLDRRGLVVGYDTRFASGQFAAAVAEVVAASGIRVYLADAPCPTPAASWNIIERGAGGAAIITASHNPAEWSGFKYKPEYAGSASEEVVEELEAHIERAVGAGKPARLPLHAAERDGLVERFDPAPPYYRQMAGLVDLGGLRDAGLTVVVDSMFGSGAGYLAHLLGGGRTRMVELHAERNPLFPGIAQPEPVARNLRLLSETVAREGADAGLALDGDADRVGLVDEHGRFITPLQMFALLALYLLEGRGQRGPLVKSLTLTSMVWRLGELFGVPVHETPVGFKHVGQVMLREEALLGGEESGGFGFRGHIPERDGVLSALYLLDAMVKLGRTPSELLRYLEERVGPHQYARWDVDFQEERRAAIRERSDRAEPGSIAGRQVVGRDTVDGIRFHLDGGAWAVVRFSGTEPLLRMYAEAESDAAVEEILKAVRELLGV